MIKFILVIFFVFLAGCSFQSKSSFWTKDKKIEEVKKDTKNVFEKRKIIEKELNSNLKIKIEQGTFLNNKSDYLANNLGTLSFMEIIKKSSKFKFSKIDNFDYFEPELIFDGKYFIFFDDKANLLKFDSDFNLVWKKNFYTKQERKLKPILTLSNNEKYLVVFDNISKFYLVDIVNGNLVWSKKNINPFNSQIKIFNDKIYAVDLNNVLRCFYLKDGKEVWNYKSENTFLKSLKRNSLIVKNNKVFFNNSLGDIVAVDADNGSLIWQTPTQSSEIYENAFSLTTSDLVAKNGDLIFSNNRNEFFSINLQNGLFNWKQQINSSVRPIFFNDFIFTVSNEGYFFVIEKKTGTIIRITDIFDGFKEKSRKKIKPIGFIVSDKKMILSLSNGRLIEVNIETGKLEAILKIDNETISRPFVFEKKIILVKNNSIIRLN